MQGSFSFAFKKMKKIFFIFVKIKEQKAVMSFILASSHYYAMHTILPKNNKE